MIVLSIISLANSGEYVTTRPSSHMIAAQRMPLDPRPPPLASRLVVSSGVKVWSAELSPLVMT
jgi:hypothetical protein